MDALLVLPTQLFEHHPLLTQKKQTVLLVEFERYFSAFGQHAQKVLLHRATMQMYKKHLEKNQHTVIYVAHHDAQKFSHILKNHNISTLLCCDPVDIPFEKQLKAWCEQATCTLLVHPTPAFLSSNEWCTNFFKTHSFSQHSFYQAQRKRLNILLTQDGSPVGGSWSFDKENRKKLPKEMPIPKIYKPRANKYQKEALRYVRQQCKPAYGSTENFIYPTTYYTAKKWLDDFLKKRFAQFGPYQDAMVQNELILFHSALSLLLNIGLVTPDYVMQKTLTYANKNKVPINSVEGFIRQLIGWREFVRAVYSLKEKTQRTSNFFGHTNKLPRSFWNGTTGIKPVDDAIDQAVSYGYNHHILRLMVVGNFMLLCEIDPNECYRWFMALFIDAYDWVMVPNVFGMSQYADGGLMTTKPYISGSNYILGMSDYKRDEWCDVWDALYWRFLYKKKKQLKKEPRMALVYSHLDRMSTTTLKKHVKTADQFLKKFLE